VVIGVPATASLSGQAARPVPGPRRPSVLTLLCVLVVAAAVVVRIAFVANQSYWTDELFSVHETSGSFGRLLTIGRTEVHTPLYAILLWIWQHLAGSSTVWTRLLSALLGLASVLAAQLCLRGAGVSLQARRLAVAVTAANGFGIVYAQEDRPYALVLLGATGFTAVTLTRLVAVRGRRASGWRSWAPWLAWGLLTATAHLLGAVLVGVVTLALASAAWPRGGVRSAARETVLGAVALVPQLAWLVVGVGRSGFASGTSWIVPPRPADVWLLLTTVFGAGRLTPRADGFAWTSPLGVVAVGVVLALGTVLAVRRLPAAGLPLPRQRASAAVDRSPVRWSPVHRSPVRLADREPDGDIRLDLRLGAVLLGIAAATVAGTYAVSQVVHIWTLRNLIVVVPALTWGAVWVAAALPATRRGRRAVAGTVLVATLLSLGALAHDLDRPYKTDWRALVHYLEQVRAEDPTATFSVFGENPSSEFPAADQGRPGSAGWRLDARIDHHSRLVTAVGTLHRIPGRQVVYFYGGVGRPRLPLVRQAILRQLDDPTCRTVPIYGLIVVSCP
jgi:hypothetical protein